MTGFGLPDIFDALDDWNEEELRRKRRRLVGGADAFEPVRTSGGSKTAAWSGVRFEPPSSGAVRAPSRSAVTSAAGGGGGAARVPVSVPLSQSVSQARMSLMVDRDRRGRTVTQARLSDPIERKISIAGGAQSAVVKISSFASGGARIRALSQYLSQGGEVQLERDDGVMVEGAQDIATLATRWSESTSQRRPSDDVLLFHLGGIAASERPKLGNLLAESLNGHRYAWRVEGDGEAGRVEVVVTAASSEKNEQGRSMRLYDTPKSLGQFEQRLKQSFGESVRFEERGFAHGVEGAARYVSRLTRGGEYEAQLSIGGTVKGHAGNLELAKSWKRDMRSQEQRNVMHVILSAKPGTDKESFVEAARATLQSSFANHEYAFALHENRRHLHVHAIVRVESRDGQRLDPKIQDLQGWRQALAQEARQRHIQMEATSRFDQANAPGYKLKDIQRVQRGTASEAVRRRVEAVQTRAVHIPTRREGMDHAKVAANEWRQVAHMGEVRARMVESEPSGQSDEVRLYRYERQGAPTSRAPVFTRERSVVEAMTAKGTGQLVYMDISKERFAALEASGDIRPSQKHAGRDYAVTPEIAREARALEAPQAQILAFQDRAQIASGQSGTVEREQDQGRHEPREESLRASQETSKPIRQEVQERRDAEEPKVMPYAENMVATRDDMVSKIEEIRKAGSSLPDDVQKELHKKTADLLSNWDKGIEAARQREQKIGEIAGEKHVEPQERKYQNFTAFTQQERGTTIVYAHKRDDGSAGSVAFVDQGQNIKVEQWKDRETNLAALQLAAEKWETITVNGPARYQKAVVELAAEHGFKIANPELQEMYQQARERFAERAGSQPGFAAGGAQEAKQTQEQTAKPQVQGGTQAPGETAPAGQAPQSQPQTAPVNVQVQGEQERQAALGIIREQVDKEAAREVRQEQIAERSHGQSGHEHVSSAKVEAAQSAERTVDSNPKQTIQVTPATSPEIERLAERQQAVVAQGDQAVAQAKEEKSEQEQKQQAEKTQAQTQAAQKPRGGQRM